MRRFRFRLDKVLRLRAHRERAARRTLAEKLSLLGFLVEDMRRLDHNLEVCRSEDHAASTAALARAMEAGLAHRRRHLTREMEVAARQVDDARRAYQQRRAGHLAISNLRVRRVTEWRREVEAEEQAEFDESTRTRLLTRTLARKAGR